MCLVSSICSNLSTIYILAGPQPSSSSQSFYLQANEEDGENGKQVFRHFYFSWILDDETQVSAV